MEEGRVPKQRLWFKPKGRKNPGRSHRRWNSQKPEQAIISLILEPERIKRRKDITFHIHTK
jgi:hypothetical protein